MKNCSVPRGIDSESQIGARPPSSTTRSVRANCSLVTKSRNFCDVFLTWYRTQNKNSLVYVQNYVVERVPAPPLGKLPRRKGLSMRLLLTLFGASVSRSWNSILCQSARISINGTPLYPADGFARYPAEHRPHRALPLAD